MSKKKNHKIREKDIIIDSARCLACGINFGSIKNGKTLHHTIPGSLEPKNNVIIALCEGCHIQVHKHLREDKIITDEYTLEDIAEKKAIIKILQEKMDLKIGRGDMYLEAIPADPDIAKILRCQVFDPLVRAQVFFWFPSDEPFEIVNYFIRADNFKYKIDIEYNKGERDYNIKGNL